MAKPHALSGFTILEMMLTLALVSIILLISMPHIPDYRQGSTEDEINNLTYLFQGAQMNALAKNKSFTVFMNYENQAVEVRDQKRHLISRHDLKVCQLEDYGLKQFTYRNNGETSAFGTVNFTCKSKAVKFIFQIQEGRFRIEQ